MSYINDMNSITMLPHNSKGVQHSLLSAISSASGKSFDQAVNENRILQGNGLICQQALCEATSGCSDVNVCIANNKDYAKIQEFCGPIQTNTVYMNGGLWRLQPVNAQQTFQSAQRQELGMSTLPNPYNVGGGMY